MSIFSGTFIDHHWSISVHFPYSFSFFAPCQLCIWDRLGLVGWGCRWWRWLHKGTTGAASGLRCQWGAQQSIPHVIVADVASVSSHQWMMKWMMKWMMIIQSTGWIWWISRLDWNPGEPESLNTGWQDERMTSQSSRLFRDLDFYLWNFQVSQWPSSRFEAASYDISMISWHDEISKEWTHEW